MPTKSEIIEKLARALMDSFKAQHDGHPIPGDYSPDSWTATGSVVDMEVMANATFNALSEYVTFLDEGSEPMHDDTVRDVTSYDAFVVYEEWNGGTLTDQFQIVARGDKPVITLQKE